MSKKRIVLGADREAETLLYLQKFQKRLIETRGKSTEENAPESSDGDHTW